MTDRTHITENSGALKGNNPYMLSRTTVADSFKNSNSPSLDSIQGYSATGEVIYKDSVCNPFSLCSAATAPTSAAKPKAAKAKEESASITYENFKTSPLRSRPRSRQLRLTRSSSSKKGLKFN